MNVEIGTKAVQFPEKEYIIGIFLAVWATKDRSNQQQHIFLRIQRSKSDIVTPTNEVSNSVLEICGCVSFM
jgi:hypothetical protein